MQNPLVTISIPLYNCEEFLERCLESVRLQTYQNIEVILVNDQTPDNSAQIAQDFIAKYRLKAWAIIHLEKNSGLSVVRNKGIDTARGKYLFFLDSDDEIFPDTIQLMVALAVKKDLEMVVGNVQTIDMVTGNISEMFNSTPKEKFLIGNAIIFENFVKGKYPTSSWNKLVRLDLLKKYGLYFMPGLFAQDSLQSFHTALKLESVGFLQENTYKYYLHDNSVIHNRKKRHFDNWMTIASEIELSLKTERNENRKGLIREHLADFKNLTLAMNWKAQKDPNLWKESYRNYKKLAKLNRRDYFSRKIPLAVKKGDLFNRLPTEVGFRFFKWRYER